MLKQTCAAIVAVLASMPLWAAEPIVLKWGKKGIGYSVAAFDIGMRGVRWEVTPCAEPNFATRTSRGVLVGCEESTVVMLDPATGAVLWKTNLDMVQPGASTGAGSKQKGFDFNTYHGEHLDAYLLSHSGEKFYLIGRKGEFLIHCSESCGSLLNRTKLYASRFIFMPWSPERGKRGIIGFDVPANKIAWYVDPCRKTYFAEQTSVGILVGCPDSRIVMLDPTTGQEIWRRDLAQERPLGAEASDFPIRKANIDRYHGEQPEGFLVSDTDNTYFAIGKKGEFLMHCQQQCAGAARTASR